MLSPLRKARLLRELSIYDVHQKTGVDTAKISLIERGYKIPSEAEKKRLAKALKTRVEEVFPEEGSHGNM